MAVDTRNFLSVDVATFSVVGQQQCFRPAVKEITNGQDDCKSLA
jgi:hypothetical protein